MQEQGDFDKDNKILPPRLGEAGPNPPLPKEGNDGVFSALSLAWELGYTIAIPIVVFALLGRLIDKWLGTSPWLLLIGIFLSIIISSYGVYFKVIKIITPPPTPPTPHENKFGTGQARGGDKNL
ncbi:MAG: AtpZ/AtpI family protein [bacterium]|nr:AtpZ/AtpI family protein [bacterium]